MYYVQNAVAMFVISSVLSISAFPLVRMTRTTTAEATTETTNDVLLLLFAAFDAVTYADFDFLLRTNHRL